jgi:methyl-accepting chemotaxis protein
MVRAMFARGRRGLVAKLTTPFIVILVGAIAVLAATSLTVSRSAMTASLDKRAEVVAGILATALPDPLAMGEVDRLQAMVDQLKKADPDLAYVIVLNAEWKAVASTVADVKHQVLTRNEFERSMAQAQGFVRRAVPDQSGLFEVAAPVKLQGNPVGVIRIGVSTAQIAATTRTTTVTMVLVGVLSLVVGIGVYQLVARRVARSLREAVTRLDELASGDADLTRRLPVSSQDEVGQLATALNTFLDNLQTLVRQIARTSRRVGAASQQMSAGSETLTSAAQQQAASLEETAASLEELAGTVKQNADNARQANQLAAGSRETAQRGGEVVTQTVTAMGEINRSSRKIADIIGVIDEIAFQTNLLALNAAVEAARAGEQGRGFAVVAAEVRNLAQRSAAAAREIKGLIQDSVVKVDDGSSLVNRSGQTLTEIVGAAKRVSDIVAEIAAASQEQSTGIDQVSRAVTQMDRLTQTNVTQTGTLSSTARDLAGEAQRLLALVSRFTLGDGAEVVESPAPAVAPTATSVARPAAAGAHPAPAAPARVAAGNAHRRPEDSFEEF